MEDEHKVWSILTPWMQWMLRRVGFSSLEMCVKAGLGTADYKFDELIADVNDLDEKPWQGPTEEWAAWSGPVFRQGRPFKLYQAHRAQIHSFGEAARALLANRVDGVAMTPTAPLPPKAEEPEAPHLAQMGVDPGLGAADAALGVGGIMVPPPPPPPVEKKGKEGRRASGEGRRSNATDPQGSAAKRKKPKAQRPVTIPHESTFRKDTERLLQKKVAMVRLYRGEETPCELDKEYWVEWEGSDEGRRLIFCCKCDKRLKVWATINGFGAHPNCQSIYRHLEKCEAIWGPGPIPSSDDLKLIFPPALPMGLRPEGPDESVPPLVNQPTKKARHAKPSDEGGVVDETKGELGAPGIMDDVQDHGASAAVAAAAAAAAAAAETAMQNPVPNSAPIVTATIAASGAASASAVAAEVVGDNAGTRPS